MRGTCAIRLCAVTALVAMGATAASASAAGPEFQVENKKTKQLEPLKKPVAFKESGGTSTISSDSGIEMTCASSSGKGKLTGPKTLAVKAIYEGCETPEATKCQSGKKPGEIKSAKLEGVLVHAMRGTSLVPAIEIGASSMSPSLFKYACGSTKVVIKGRVLAAITPIEVATTEMTEVFAEGTEPEPGCGKQEIQLVEGVGPCRHLEMEVGGEIVPVSTTAEKKKEYVGHVSILK